MIAGSSPPLERAPSFGFTLLEVLVVVAVLGLLFLGLLQGSRVVLMGWDRQSGLVTRTEDLDAVDRTLRRVIAQARPGSEWEPLVFAGTAHSLTFTSVLPLPDTGVSTQRADVELAVDAAHRLLLVWTPHLHAIRVGRTPQAVATEILQGVARLEVSYWPEAGVGGWTSTWHGADPPRLVRLRIVFSDPDHGRWPDILAPTMLDPP